MENNLMLMATDLHRVSTEDLRAELSRAITVTAQTLQHMAMIWRELERRGEDLSGLRSGLAAYLEPIAAGKLRAEAVVKYAHKTMLLAAMTKLPLEQQDELLQRESIEVAEVREKDVTVSVVPLTRISAPQIRTAFGPHGVRSNLEQTRLALAEAKVSRGKERREPRAKDRHIKVDATTGCLRAGRAHFVSAGQRLSAHDALDALSAFFGVDLREMLPNRGEGQ